MGHRLKHAQNSDNPHQATRAWRVNTAHVLSWRTWDGEVVIYDDLSGDTMKLELMMAEAFHYLQRKPASQSDLIAFLARSFDLQDDARLEDWAARLIERFERAGLIEPAENPDAEPSQS